MTIAFLHGLFYLGVLGLVVGCFAYLVVNRDPNQASRSAVRKAEKLSGTYRLAELESILEKLAGIEAWGVILELRLPRVRQFVQMFVHRGEVELFLPSLDPGDMERFRQAVEDVGLQVRTVEGQHCLDVVGDRPAVARTIRRILASFCGVGEDEEVQVRIFQ